MSTTPLRSYVLSFLLYFSVCFVAVEGGCERFDGTPAICWSYINYDVFIPDAINQSSLAQFIDPIIQPLKYIVDRNCSCIRTSLEKILCGAAFPRCVTVGTATVPQKPCRSLCESALVACAGILQPAQLPDCSATDPFNQPIYPEESNSSASTCATEMPQIADVLPNCTGPFGLARRDGACKIKCPVPVWDSPTHNDDIALFNRIATPISIVALVLAFFLQLAGAGAKFPADIILNYIIILIPTNIQLMMMSYNREIACADGGTPNDQTTNTACAFAGFLFSYFFNVSSAWFFCTSLNTLLTLLPPTRAWLHTHQKHCQIGYYVMCYGIPWIPTIVVLSKKLIVGGGLLCQIDGQKKDGWYVDGLLFVWLGTWDMAAVLCLLVVFVQVIRQAGIQSIKRHTRLLVFLSVFSYLSVYAISFRIYIRMVAHRVSSSLVTYATCTVQGQVNCHPGQRFSATADYVLSVNQLISSVSAFFLFGLTMLNIRQLIRLTRATFLGNFKEASSIINESNSDPDNYPSSISISMDSQSENPLHV